MAMSVIWTAMVVFSVVCAFLTGNQAQLTTAALEGAQSAVSLCLSIAGTMCLWSGLMEVMHRSGIAAGLSTLLKPILGRVFPAFRNDRAVMGAISANVSANLLGLGNAATPFGIEAVQRMKKKNQNTASDSLCTLVVCNTASIQLIPTTVAAVRLGAGCQTPFDILPAVWLSSALSVATGLFACKLFSWIWNRREGGKT